MSIASRVAPHLPFLRRFARTLTGNQGAGDAYAVATLDAILEDPASFGAKPDARVALYHLFLKIWGSFSVNSKVEPVGVDQAMMQKFAAMTRQSLIAFLLHSVEGFSIEDVGNIMECTPSKVGALIDQAGREIAEQIRTDVLIIEDEPFIALDLQSLVESLGHKVVEIARTHSEALAAVKRHSPGLILADVQLADGSSGIEAVSEILQEFEIPVIFITAYPERLLTGERPEPTFLVSKPFEVDNVKAIISQALFFEQKSYPQESEQLAARAAN